MYIGNIILFGMIMLGIMVSATPEQSLSVIEAACIIWRMNYKDVCNLHTVVFPAKQDADEGKTSYIEQMTQKIYEIRKAISEKIFGKTMVDRVLQTYFAVSFEEQEVLKAAIKGSYDEYTCFNGFAALMAIITFPIGLLFLMLYQWEHVKKVEAVRARLSEAV